MTPTPATRAMLGTLLQVLGKHEECELQARMDIAEDSGGLAANH